MQISAITLEQALPPTSQLFTLIFLIVSGVVIFAYVWWKHRKSGPPDDYDLD